MAFPKAQCQNHSDHDLQHPQATSFANDMRILKHIQAHNDIALLQANLDKVIAWAAENNMQLNGDKFETIRYDRLQELKATRYTCNQQHIAIKHRVKVLGVHMSNDTTFTLHYCCCNNNITEMAHRLTGWILRSFRTKRQDCMLTLWKSLVLPKLEYCCHLWFLHKVGDISRIEAVQRSFTSCIKGMECLSYWKRVQHLCLYSLQWQQERYTIMYMWKTLGWLVPYAGLNEHYHPRRGRLCYIKRTEGVPSKV